MATISSPIVRLPTSRNPSSQYTVQSPFPSRRRSPIPEPKPLDHRILKHGGTTSTLELLPHRVQCQKSEPVDLKSRNESIVRENEYLRQEIARLTKVQEAFVALRESFMEVFYTSQTALQIFSDKVVRADRELAGYWGLELDDTKDDDIVMF